MPGRMLLGSLAAHHQLQAFARRLERRHGVGDGALGGFELANGCPLDGRQGAQRHSSDADQTQVVQSLEGRRCVNARAFDRDDSGLLQARDRRIDVSGRATECPIHSLPLATADAPHNFQNDQIFRVMHLREGIS
jgi:hypothetical protein